MEFIGLDPLEFIVPFPPCIMDPLPELEYGAGRGRGLKPEELTDWTDPVPELPICFLHLALLLLNHTWIYDEYTELKLVIIIDRSFGPNSIILKQMAFMVFMRVFL